MFFCNLICTSIFLAWNFQYDLVIMPSTHLNHQACYWGGVQNGKNLIVLYKENIFYEQWHLIP